MSSFYVDVRQVRALAGRFKNGQRIMQKYLVKAVGDIGYMGQALGQSEAPVRTGTLRRSIIRGPVVTSGTTIKTTIGTVLKYAPIVHNGRGGITASGKALTIRIGTTTVLRKSAGPAKANPFMDRAFDSLVPLAFPVIEQAAFNALNEIIGGA